MALLLDHSDARREARIKRASEIRKFVLAAIPAGESLTIWQVVRAVRGERPGVGYVDVVVALGALCADGAVAGDADGYRRV